MIRQPSTCGGPPEIAFVFFTRFPTFITPLLHIYYTFITPFLHLYYTFLTPSLHLFYTFFTPYLHLFTPFFLDPGPRAGSLRILKDLPLRDAPDRPARPLHLFHYTFFTPFLHLFLDLGQNPLHLFYTFFTPLLHLFYTFFRPCRCLVCITMFLLGLLRTRRLPCFHTLLLGFPQKY